MSQLGVDFSHYQLKFGSPEDILNVAADADIVVVNMAAINREVIEGFEHCKLIIRHGAGYDNVDIPAASERGIVVAYVPDYCVNEVAEQAVMLIMACQRKLLTQIKILGRSSQAGIFLFEEINPIYAIHGKTLGIIGLGRIGSRVFTMMQGFQMNYLICDPYLSEERKQEFGINTVSFSELLTNSDIVTVHTPLNEETYHYLDQPEFKLMKPTASLVNTSRGAIINLVALDIALREGELALAGIDVYEEEPPPSDHPILHNEKAICTPHLAWLSEEAAWDIRVKIVEDVKRFINGQGPRFPINKDVKIRFQ